MTYSTYIVRLPTPLVTAVKELRVLLFLLIRILLILGVTIFYVYLAGYFIDYAVDSYFRHAPGPAIDWVQLGIDGVGVMLLLIYPTFLYFGFLVWAVHEDFLPRTNHLSITEE